jgi:putative ABC transport system permease protein
VAGARSAAQLLATGLVLGEVLVSPSPVLPLVCVLVMLLAAGHTVLARLGPGARGLLAKPELGAILGGEAFLAFGIAALALSSATRDWLPFLGLVVGNSLAALTLAVDRLRQGVRDNLPRIESDLAVGASRMESLQPLIAQAMRAAMTPILNSLSTAGLVSFPGALTGQLLAGEDPRRAVGTQLLILLAVALLSLLGSWTAVRLALVRLWRESGLAEGRP